MASAPGTRARLTYHAHVADEVGDKQEDIFARANVPQVAGAVCHAASCVLPKLHAGELTALWLAVGSQWLRNSQLFLGFMIAYWV
jgi:hypothetical protein